MTAGDAFHRKLLGHLSQVVTNKNYAGILMDREVMGAQTFPSAQLLPCTTFAVFFKATFLPSAYRFKVL
jgi:hypothetical protein